MIKMSDCNNPLLYHRLEFLLRHRSEPCCVVGTLLYRRPDHRPEPYCFIAWNHTVSSPDLIGRSLEITRSSRVMTCIESGDDVHRAMMTRIGSDDDVYRVMITCIGWVVCIGFGDDAA